MHSPGRLRVGEHQSPWSRRRYVTSDAYGDNSVPWGLAEDNGWPVHDFQKKVRVRPWHRPHPGKAAVYAVVGLAALGSGLAWQKRRQRA